MEVPTCHAAEVLQIAKNFRARAAEAGDIVYRHLMLRTAIELEERAVALIQQSDSGTVLIEQEDAAA